MERHDASKGVIEIRHMMCNGWAAARTERQTIKTDRWLVVKKVLNASHISSQVGLLGDPGQQPGRLVYCVLTDLNVI